MTHDSLRFTIRAFGGISLGFSGGLDLLGNLLGSDSDVFVEANANQLDAIIFAQFSFLSISFNHQPECGCSAKEFQRLKMLLPHVFDRDSSLRHIDVQMLRLKPCWSRVLDYLHSFQETTENLIKLVFRDPR